MTPPPQEALQGVFTVDQGLDKQIKNFSNPEEYITSMIHQC